MKFRKTDSNYVIKLDKGDEIIKELTEFCKKQNIKAAHFTGIGAASRVLLGWFNPKTKAYESKEFIGDREITSLVGNVGVLDNGDVGLHTHINLSDKEYSLIGGHVFKCEISLACEIFLVNLGEEIRKSPDNEFGLNFIKL